MKTTIIIIIIDRVKYLVGSNEVIGTITIFFGRTNKNVVNLIKDFSEFND